jgi:glycogen synthase
MPEHERASRERRGREHALAFDRVRVFDELFRCPLPATEVIQLRLPDERASESV